MKVKTLAEQLLFSTLRIETQATLGTGTIVNHKWSDDREGPFLVTNKHVIEGAAKIKLTFTLRTDAEGEAQPVLGTSHTLTFDTSPSDWTKHASSAVDIAIAPLAPVIENYRRRGIDVFYKGVPTAFVPGKDIEFDAVEEVLFIGYPSGIYDKANNLPISRKGITATPCRVDYESNPVFLIDASVFPGSSGSPVFLYNPALGGQRFFWLGILGSVYYRQDDGVVRFEEIPTDIRPVIKTTQMVDLGVVYKAHTVVDTIEDLLRQRGELPTEASEVEAAS